jgi:3-deoxy-D-manno-octulosonic-acid transferase
VAGSTHEGEEIIILDVYKQLLNLYSDFKLILIPRHIERGQEVIRLVKQYGFQDSLTMTEINQGLSRRNQRVLVVDVIGELFKIYSLATIVFCGGSLVRKGGQNILEPAAWGKVVLYGPSMEDFRDEKTLLEEAGAGITVMDSHDLFDRILALLRDPETLTRKGQIAGQVIAANRGASQRYASLIKEVLMSKNRIS